jgi:ribosomal protein L16
MTEEISKMAQGKQIKIDIQEIKSPELDAQLVAENVRLQIERRIAYRRAMKKAVQTAMDFGAQGIRLRCSARLNGAEISRSEWYREGKVPSHTLRTAIDYGFAEANTVYGKIGVKCWICKKEEAPAESPRRRRAATAPAESCSSLRREFMPLMPKRVKYRKSQRGSRKGTASRNLRIDFGEFRFADTRTRLDHQHATRGRARRVDPQHEAQRKALDPRFSRQIRYTARPPETRMGKGKGQPEFWVATVRPGQHSFRARWVPESVARESLRLAADKLPVRTKFLSRHHVRAA